MADEEERETSPGRPGAMIDPRVVELELAGAVFTTDESRVLFRRMLRDAESRGFDKHHEVCLRLIDDLRREWALQAHEMRKLLQAQTMRIAALEERIGR